MEDPSSVSSFHIGWFIATTFDSNFKGSNALSLHRLLPPHAHNSIQTQAHTHTQFKTKVKFTPDSGKRASLRARKKQTRALSLLAKQFCLWPALFMSRCVPILQAIELHYPFHSYNMNRIQMRYLMMSCLSPGFGTAWLAAANSCQPEGRCASATAPTSPRKTPAI